MTIEFVNRHDNPTVKILAWHTDSTWSNKQKPFSTVTIKGADGHITELSGEDIREIGRRLDLAEANAEVTVD